MYMYSLKYNGKQKLAIPNVCHYIINRSMYQIVPENKAAVI